MWGSFYTLIPRYKPLDIIKYTDLFQQTKIMITILPNPLTQYFLPAAAMNSYFHQKLHDIPTFIKLEI